MLMCIYIYVILYHVWSSGPACAVSARPPAKTNGSTGSLILSNIININNVMIIIAFV